MGFSLRINAQWGLIDGTKCQSSEQKGNLFCLLCIAHRTTSRTVLQKALQFGDRQWMQFLLLKKIYLAMEEWFHDINDKDEVRVS
jgi:hypothetical protein